MIFWVPEITREMCLMQAEWDFFLWKQCKTLKNHQISQTVCKKMKKSHVQLAFNLFFGWFQIPKNLIYFFNRYVTKGEALLKKLIESYFWWFFFNFAGFWLAAQLSQLIRSLQNSRRLPKRKKYNLTSFWKLQYAIAIIEIWIHT